MAKRFIDTKIWDKAWFRKLSTKNKLVWIYLLGKCDHAGIWDADWELAEFIIGESVTYDQLPDVIKDKMQYIKGEDQYYIPSFIDFQYGGLEKLQMNVRPQKAVIERLHQQGLIDKNSFQYTEKAETTHIKPEEVLLSYQTELEKDFPDKNVKLEIQTMVDWLKANGKTKKNYRAFARNWLRSSFNNTPKSTKYKLSDFKTTVDGRSYIGRCVSCEETLFYSKTGIFEDSRCCKA